MDDDVNDEDARLYFANKGGSKGCRFAEIPVPWDAAFLKSWDRLLQKIANHLNKTTYENELELDALVGLRLTGINMDSDELHLPGQNVEPGNPIYPCVKDTVSEWQKAQYTPDNLLKGWESIVNAFNNNFQGKYFSVAIIDSTYPFPPIDNNGKILKEKIIKDATDLSVTQNQPLLQYASQVLGGQSHHPEQQSLRGSPRASRDGDFRR